LLSAYTKQIEKLDPKYFYDYVAVCGREADSVTWNLK